MTNEEILSRYNSAECDVIYGFMYGEPYIFVGGNPRTYRPDEIIEIEKSNLRLGKNKNCFIFVWGWPGPDANIYYFKDYGRTWAFSPGEIVPSTPPNHSYNV